MSPRGVMPARPRTPTATRSRSGARRRARVVALTTAVLGLVGAGVVAPPSGQASPLAPSVASGETRTFTDPHPGSAITVEVTPGDSSTWRQGDVVHVHVTGMSALTTLKVLGTCPAGMPPVSETPPTGRKDKHVLDPTFLFNACNAQFSTAIPGGADLTGDTPALSTRLTSRFGRQGDGSMDVSFRVGMGAQQNTDAPIFFYNDTGAETQPSLTCDTTHPCVVGFGFARGDGTFWSNVTDLPIAPVKAASFDTGSCTGLDQGTTLTAAGPERLQTPLSGLDKAFCATKSSPIPVSFLSSEIGEAGPTGVSTVGTSADLAFIGSPALSTTPLTAGQVAVPIALNAAAVAQTGGISSPSITSGQFAYNPETLPRINLVPSDVAGIVLHDFTTAPYDANTAPPGFNPLGDRIAGRPGNDGLKEFDTSHAGLPFTQVTTPTYGVGQNSVAVALSDYLTSTAPSAWVYPENAINKDLGRDRKPVGALTSFDPLVDHSDSAPHLTSQMSSINSIYAVMATKDSPNFTVTEGFTSVCPLSSPVSPFASNRWAQKACVRFVVLDAASAAAVGLEMSAIGAGTTPTDYVTPSAATMQAAAGAAAGRLGSKGYFPATASGAYPMTFVEYAVVSTNALVDDSCAPRTAQQKMLKDFLGYATTAGQTALPAGLAGLTPDLAAQAAAAIAKIGTTTVARCVKQAPVPPKPTPAPSPALAPPAALDNGSTGGDTSGSGGGTTSGDGAGTSTTDGGQATTEASTALASNAREKPVILSTKQIALQDATFSGASRTSPVSAVVGLLVLLLLIGVGAAWAAGALTLPGLGQRVPPVSPTTTGGTR